MRPPSGRSIFRLPLIPPTARLSVAWWILMLVIDATYTAFAVPIGAAFCTYRGGGDDDARADASSPGVGACSIVELVFGAIFVLNLFLSLATGMIVTCEYKAHDVLDGHLVARIYTRRAQFYIDLLSVLPFIYRVVLFAAYGAGSELNVLWVEQLLRALTLMRMGRILKFASLSKLLLMDATSGQILSRYVSAPLLYTIVLSYGLAVAINLIAMIFVMIAFGEGVSNSWMTSWAKLFAPDLTTASQTTQYLAAVYWMVVSATTTGFGDVTAQTVAELILQMVVLVVGMVLYGMLTATVTEALGRANTKAVASRAFQIKMADVAAWMSESRVPDKLQHAVFSYYAQVWTLRRGASLQAEVLQELPKFLRAKVSPSCACPCMRAVQTVKGNIAANSSERVWGECGLHLREKGGHGEQVDPSSAPPSQLAYLLTTAMQLKEVRGEVLLKTHNYLSILPYASPLTLECGCATGVYDVSMPFA